MTGWLDTNGAAGVRRQRESMAAAAMNGATITPRQRQVLPLICGGLSNKEMAADLYVGEDDVEYLVRELFGRTGARNRTQLAAWAVEHHLGDSGIR